MAVHVQEEPAYPIYHKTMSLPIFHSPLYLSFTAGSRGEQSKQQRRVHSPPYTARAFHLHIVLAMAEWRSFYILTFSHVLGQGTAIVCPFVFSIQCGSASHCIGGPIKQRWSRCNLRDWHLWHRIRRVGRPSLHARWRACAQTTAKPHTWHFAAYPYSTPHDCVT